jgi:hypothetical protein
VKKLLGRVQLCDLLEGEFERSGLLDVTFSSTRPDATLVSLDGNRSVVWVTPAGTIGALLVQDYALGESRSIPFALGTIELVACPDEIAVFLVT